MYDVCHLNPSLDSFEVVLVVPHFIGPVSLFINKKTALFYVGYFGHPVNRDAEHGPDLVLYNLARVHGFAMVNR